MKKLFIGMTPEQLAELFHATYESLAPKYNYSTRISSRTSWENVPERNKAMMVATCKEVLRVLSENGQIKKFYKAERDMLRGKREV